MVGKYLPSHPLAYDPLKLPEPQRARLEMMATSETRETIKAETSHATALGNSEILHDQLRRVLAKEEAANRAVEKLKQITSKIEETIDTTAVPELSSWKILTGALAPRSFLLNAHESRFYCTGQGLFSVSRRYWR